MKARLVGHGMTRGGVRAATFGLALALGASASTRAAAQPPTVQTSEYSPYEEETIDDALQSLGATRAGAAEHQVVEGVDIVTLEVFEERDPVPHFVNIFHATTRPYVIEREVLLRPGDRYAQVRVDESLRNLRKLPQLSVVLAVPVQGHAPGTVRLLVITKDVWSLRLNQTIGVSSAGLETLTIQPSETNVLGTHQSASLLFALDPGTYALGAAYRIPRLGGSRVVLSASANVVLNRSSGALEGSYGSLLAAQPLYSALTRWAWDSQVTWDTEITRRYVNAKEATYDAKVTPDVKDAIPWEYPTRRYFEQTSLTRSYGVERKNDFSVGAQVDLRRYTVEARPGVDPAALDEFTRKVVPRSENRLGPFAQWHAYTTTYVRVLDFETLGLQEDYRLGPEVYARVYPVLDALGSSRNLLGLYASAQVSVALSDGYVRGLVESTTEGTTETISDGALAAAIHLVTPRLGFGRFVYDARVLSRYRNYLNRTSYLGGNTRLRGYPSNFFVGEDVVSSNFEYRTRPVEILHVQLGGALFYDAGSAFDGFENLRPVHSVGTGFRFLFPQFDRLVLRGDFGFPLGNGARLPGVAPMSFYLAFEQAFGVPSATTAALPSGG